ncbi:MAG: hypothetical protein KJ065_19345, partial [Anaerolineae bacterium]|nr:hypothetical protein [Anaerolineae bacterium]
MGRRTLRIFLSSPGDTADERTIARGVFDTLRYDPLLRKRVELEVIAWDDPHGDTPFIATLTPQQAIDRGLPKPSECDIVVVILWSRIGTLLDSRVHGTKADGTPYLSGTEWEFYDAMNASAKTGKPIVLVYRRMEPYYLDPSASDFQEKHRQWQRVTDFFEHFTNPDGSYRQGYNEYKSSDEFQRRLEAHLKTVIGDILEQDNTANQTDPKISTREMVVWRGAPFPGLRSFEIGEGQIFFGRSSETASLIRRLGQVETRMIAVVGASGSGKSSLIKAGVIPRLRDGAISGSKNWCVSVFRPAPFGNADPFENLVTALPISKSANVTEVSGWAVRLKADSNALHDLVYTSLHDAPSWSELLIVIDQFEEVFSLANRSDLVAFIELLVTAVQTPRVRVILTLRADYYAHCLAYPRLARLLQDATFPLSAPGTEALRDMITRPAQMAGLRFENGLVERILDDTGMEPGALALMAFTLDELYRFSKKNNVLTHAVYETLGGVQGALAERAEDVFSHLAPTTKEAFPIVFRELCEVDDDSRITGRRASPSFLGQRGEVSRLADEFVKARLLTMGRNEDEKPTIEVAHEALFRSWPRLAKWIEETSDDLRLVRQLRFAAKYWDQTGRQTEELLGGSRLERAQQWLHTMQFDFDDLMREFVEASAIHQRRQYRTRNRYRVGLFIAGGLAIVMLIGFLFVQNQTQLDANIRLAASAATAVRSFDEAQSILLSNGVLDAIYRGLPDVALALAVQANQISNPPMEARRGLIEAVS